jgi:general secretion pathway protein A
MPLAPTLQSESSLSGGEYYPSPLHEEAFARLAYLAAKPSGCGLLLGPSGCGKTLILSLFAQEQKKAGAAVAAISAVDAATRDILLEIGSGWGAPVRAVDDLACLWRKTTDRLRELHYEQTPALLLADDLHQATAEEAALVDRLQSFREASEVNLVVIAAGQEHCENGFSSRLLARVQLRIELDFWTLEETAGYLQHWLAQNVAQDQEFDSQAIEVLHELAEGVPRKVRRLAELAAYAGSGRDKPWSEDVVRGAFEELISP